MAKVHAGSSSSYARTLRTKRDNRRGTETVREQPVGLSPAWEIIVAPDDCMDTKWPQTERQRNEDALAATFFRKPRRMEI